MRQKVSRQLNKVTTVYINSLSERQQKIIKFKYVKRLVKKAYKSLPWNERHGVINEWKRQDEISEAKKKIVKTLSGVDKK
jgi:hypothetical protein